jgi:hypothetical protein
MQWHRSKVTGHWCANEESHHVRLEKSTWGNSKDSAWEIFIDGISHGKELTIRDAKLEAERELNLKEFRAGGSGF